MHKQLSGFVRSVPAPRMPAVGTPPGIDPPTLPDQPATVEPLSVMCTDYGAEEAQTRQLTSDQEIREFLSSHRPEWAGVRWIDVASLSDPHVLRSLAEKYEVHPLAVEDMLSSQRPKVDDYPGSHDHPGRLFIVADVILSEQGSYRREQVCLLLGRSTLLSVHDCRDDIFGPVRRRLESEGSLLRRNDAGFLCYSLLDSLVDRNFPILEELSDRLEDLETRVLLTHPSRQFGNEIYHLRHELMLMRRSAWPMRDLVNQICRDRHECLSATTQMFFRDMYDHVVQISEYVETYREVANSLAEMHISAMSNRMNQVMKTLTIVSTIFVPLTFLAGVYGMNMPIPENQHAITYPVFWIVSVCCALGMLVAFRLRDWI